MNDTAVLSIEAPRSKANLAYELLEEKIVTMELAPGGLLSESKLVEQLGLGRTPVREALQRLEAENLVEIMPRRGIRTTPIDVTQQLRLLEARRALEELQVQLTTRRASQEQKASFEKISKQMLGVAESRDYRQFIRLDKEFNELMAESTDNEFVSNMLRQLHGLSRRFWHKHHSKTDDLAHVARLHADVGQAIVAGDEAGAVLACQAHMEYIQAFTLATLER